MTMEASPDKIHKGLICPAVFIMRGATVLIGLRHYTEPGFTVSLWTTPGGKCELGEDPEAAVRRETEEEVGITDLRDLRRIGEVPGASGRGDIVHLYVATSSQEPRNMEPDKFSEWKFVPLDEVPENFINKDAIEQLKAHLKL